MTRAILFDLDGTLLPIEFEEFFARYVESVCRFYRAAAGLELGPGLQPAVATMMANAGARRNAEVFWEALAEQIGCERSVLEDLFAPFIEREGAALGNGVVPDRAASRVVKAWKARGAKVVLATNPVFPRLVIDLRTRWGALEPELFDLVTCTENMSFCKPHPDFYRDVAESVGVHPRDCLMVGNDDQMDLAPASKAGMRTCLITGPYMVRNDTKFVPDHTCSLSEVESLP